jgi:DNA primase
MENSKFSLGLLEVLFGEGKGSKAGINYAFHCPFCNHHKPKLVINLETGQFNCWTCSPATKGTTIFPLLKKVGASEDQVEEFKNYYNDTRSTRSESEDLKTVSLPKEFRPLLPTDTALEARHARAYVTRRGLTPQDIRKYNIGYCATGRYRNRVIVPSYDSEGQINYFIARSVDEHSSYKIDTPTCNKNELIGFEYFINWEVPVILCEGVFDAIAIKRNAIPLFGKTIPKALMMKLSESAVKTVYLALDTDAITSALEHSQRLLDLGKEVYLINLDGKDPSEIGFTNMLGYLHEAKPLTFMDIFRQKMQLS